MARNGRIAFEIDSIFSPETEEASSVSGEKIESISKAILPFLAIEVIVIFLITYVEPISLGIPRFFGFISGG